ncbi:MAG: hypothetical protein EPN79_15665 [Burkholderiaceae bacterium]|nr:MAG: hypothetical protein EPN79_15665 [Burkholderiaceae bacterium]
MIVKWHELGRVSPLDRPGLPANHVRGWARDSDGRLQSTCQRVDALGRLASLREQTGWHCDIRDIAGFSASKSDLDRTATMDDFARAFCPRYIEDVSETGLRKNLAHSEIRILHSANSADHFVSYAWDGRLMLANGGGSHHLAAACYIARRTKTAVPVAGTLYEYKLDPTAINALRGSYEILLVPDDVRFSNGLFDALQADAVSHYWMDVPRQLPGLQALLLPRGEVRSMRAAEILKEAGAFDLGQHLTNLVVLQERHAATLPALNAAALRDMPAHDSSRPPQAPRVAAPNKAVHVLEDEPHGPLMQP